MKTTLCLIFAAVLTFSYTDGSASFQHSPLVYNFYDMLAQAACTAKATTSDRIWAMRRNCAPGGTRTCEDVCNENSLTCFQTYHVYKNPKILAQNSDSDPDEAVDGLSIYNYLGSCSFQAGACGPNYCCCKGPYNALN